MSADKRKQRPEILTHNIKLIYLPSFLMVVVILTIGLIGIHLINGKSPAFIKNINGEMIFQTFAFSCLISLLILWVQGRYIIWFVLKLNRDISGLDIENRTGLHLTVSRNNPFKGIYTVINQMFDKINESIFSIREYQTHLEHMAYHDALTGLPNRSFFMEKLQKALDDQQTGGLFLVDISGTKEISDIMGHVYADAVLKSLSENLLREKPESAIVSRFDWGELALLVTGNSDVIRDTHINLIDAIGAPVRVNGDVFEIECSLGIALFPQDGRNADELIGKADIAMIHVKESLGRGFAFFEPGMLSSIKENNRITAILKQAVKKQGFKVLYQPIVETGTGKIAWFEALLRLKDNDLSAARFIKVAEDKGLIAEICCWTLHHVIRQLSDWKQRGMDIRPVSVNLSPKQIGDRELVEHLRQLFHRYKLEPSYLEIEITENVFIEDAEKTYDFLQELRSMGIRIALDDFGSGYSSLNYLTFMPVNTIKLDKSINDRYLNSHHYSIIQHLISLSHDLNLKIVAEGIETREQQDILNRIGCDYIQGYLFSKPVEAGIAESMQVTRTFFEC